MNLTDEELVVLDGRCRPETQVAVDAAKARLAAVAKFAGLTEAQAKFVADVRTEAETNGRLVFYYERIKYCRVCKKSAGYAIRTRSSRTGRKGKPNHDRPLTLSGIELAKRFVTMRGYATLGCCRDCWDTLQPYVATQLDGVQAEIPAQIAPSHYRYYDNRKCEACGWEGHEGEMRQARTLMGDGYYPAGCPNCKAENRIFGQQQIKGREGFTLVTIPVIEIAKATAVSEAAAAKETE